MDALTPERRIQIEGRQASSSQVTPIFGTYYAKDTADLLAEVDRLRDAIGKAPHSAYCWGGTIAAGGSDENPNRHTCMPKCWKSGI